jgi:hypothetical protein
MSTSRCFQATDETDLDCVLSALAQEKQRETRRKEHSGVQIVSSQLKLFSFNGILSSRENFSAQVPHLVIILRELRLARNGHSHVQSTHLLPVYSWFIRSYLSDLDKSYIPLVREHRKHDTPHMLRLAHNLFRNQSSTQTFNKGSIDQGSLNRGRLQLGLHFRAVEAAIQSLSRNFSVFFRPACTSPG